MPILSHRARHDLEWVGALLVAVSGILVVLGGAWAWGLL